MSSRELRPAPASRPLLIGQYANEFLKPEFAFHGTIRRLVFESAEPVLRQSGVSPLALPLGATQRQ
jgi:hypothetical protein